MEVNYCDFVTMANLKYKLLTSNHRKIGCQIVPL